jgi:hypothetical protein
VIDAAAAGLFRHGIGARQCFESDLPVGGHVDLELLVEDDPRLAKVVLRPELSPRERGVHGSDRTELDGLARPQARHGHVFLAEVGVDRRDALDGGRQILNRIVRRRHHRAVGLAHAHELNVDPLARAVVAEYELPPRLNAGFTLSFHAQVHFTLARTVVFEPVYTARLFDDERLRRIVLRFGWRRWTGWLCPGCSRKRQRTEDYTRAGLAMRAANAIVFTLVLGESLGWAILRMRLYRDGAAPGVIDTRQSRLVSIQTQEEPTAAHRTCPSER